MKSALPPLLFVSSLLIEIGVWKVDAGWAHVVKLTSHIVGRVYQSPANEV